MSDFAILCARYSGHRILRESAEPVRGPEKFIFQDMVSISRRLSRQRAVIAKLAMHGMVNLPLFDPLLHEDTVMVGWAKIYILYLLTPTLAGNTTTKEFKVAKILFADDDVVLGDLVFHKLESCGHSVSVVDNGYSVLSAAICMRPDIIILDDRMPGLTGPEVLHNLKRDARTLAIPVLVLTSQTGKNDMVDAYSSGAADYMEKPFSPQDLANRMSTLLGAQQFLQQVGA